MRRIQAAEITRVVKELCIEANTVLRSDVYRTLRVFLGRENNRRARKILKALLENADYARKLDIAICQDTGLAYVFTELGQQVLISAGSFLQAVNKGIDQGYRQGHLRNSVISHPLNRNTKPGFSPGVVHIDLVRGRRIKLTVLPKGFGSENKSAVKMFNPTSGQKAIKEFVVSAVKQAGPNACPPFVVGVGIGGGLDQAVLLAKKALLGPIDRKNPDRLLSKLEQELLTNINRLGLGPLGLGGKTTALAVKVLAHPTHIAGLPVAVNISCHALRSASRRI